MDCSLRHIIAIALSITMSLTVWSRDFVVVIDPGHGGKDYGCIGKLTNEKTIVLDVAKALGKKITDSYDDVKVIYTRESDRYLTLQERADKANKAGGDLFISIHVNSVDRRSKGREKVAGASVYTLGLHKSDNNLQVAMRENSVIELEQDYSENYQGFDPSSSESYIIFELSQNRHLQQSIEFARLAQQQLTTTAGRADKQVRQAGFWVLWATSMPAVLVELDFICNPAQEKFLNSKAGKEKCAEALFNAFKEYRSAMPADDLPSTSADDRTGQSAGTPSVENTYHVQFLTSSKPIRNGSKLFRGVKDVHSYKDGGIYKYYSGNFPSFNDAQKHLSKIKRSFPEAFIIHMCNGKRIKN